MSLIQHIESKDHLHSILQGPSKLVVVDIYAEWCGPCKQLAPKLEKMASDFQTHSVIICKVDLEKVPIEGISSVPTIQFWELLAQGQRKLTKTVVGADAQEIQNAIERIVSGDTYHQEAPKRGGGPPRGRVYATFGSL